MMILLVKGMFWKVPECIMADIESSLQEVVMRRVPTPVHTSGTI